MSVSRRALFRNVGSGAGPLSGAFVSARGREALVAENWPETIEASMVPPPQAGEIRISSNENPLGPGERALEALRSSFELGNRYPTNTQPSMADLRAILAEGTGARPANVILGAGSGEILKNAAHAFASSERHFVTARPSYEAPARVARYVGAEVRYVPVDGNGMLDLEAMAGEASGAGLVFVCNPNNPTGTVHGADAITDFVAEVHRSSPETVIHIDEAYHEYVTDPGYASAVGLALETPNLFVSRTFSKAYGMAGMRIGYGVGHEDLMRRLGRYTLTFNTNTVGQIAAHAAAQDPGFVETERARNTAAKAFTVEFFTEMGFRVMDSQTNFIFVELGRPASEFRDACRQHGVSVGRDFPPLENTHCRISIGTMEEMERAADVFRTVLT